MKTLDPDKPIVLLGDNHGNWGELFYLLDKKSINNCYLISVGDCGIGFFNKKREIENFKKLNSFFSEKKIYFKAIRGNHDDPLYFRGGNRINMSNFELIEDYSVYKHGSKEIQLIGGAISIDRVGRKLGTSYWEQEAVQFRKELCRNVDILITHTAPSYCFPQQFNEMVYGWAKEDAYLIEDLLDERSVMDEIFKICQPKQHFYGHFHSSWNEKVNQCRHKLLDINELFQII